MAVSAYEAVIDFFSIIDVCFINSRKSFTAEKLRRLHENFIDFCTCQSEHPPFYLCWLRRYEK
jgi:hypothetical protein